MDPNSFFADPDPDDSFFNADPDPALKNFSIFSVDILQFFFLLDPDPGGKLNAYPCGSGSTAKQSIGFIHH